MTGILILIAALAALIVSVYAGVKVALMAFNMISNQLWGMLAAVITFSIVAGIVNLILMAILAAVGLEMIV